ncbi:MAG: hypothetical protein WC129_05660 [Sphaerochaetaceae bacterium]
MNPTSPLGAPSSLLEGSPFTSYLIPGIVLFVFLGIGNCLGALIVFRNSWLKGFAEGILGFGLTVWIIVQVIVIDTIAFPHIVFFCIGVLQSASAIILLLKEKATLCEHLSKLRSKIRKA